MSSTFPTGVLWVEQHVTVTAKMAAVFVVGSAVGEMAIPAVVGFGFEHTGPLSLMYTTLACVAGCAITFLAMQCCVLSRRSRYRLVDRRTDSHPMQDFNFSDSDELTDTEPIVRKNGYHKANHSTF